MDEELRSIERDLRNSPSEWQWHVARAICQIPRGNLATYGDIAKVVNYRHGLRINARNVAWLRRKLYVLLSHDTKVPLHRVAKNGDVESLADSEITRNYNDRLRDKEGSLNHPVWWRPTM
jgi:alkylated DNA nucleotide flippase Atl1